MPGVFKLDERVECRDHGEDWKVGTVVSVEPLKVKPDGWDQSFAWQEVRVSNGIPSGIHSVALSGDKDELEKLLANRAFSKEDVDVKDEDGSTPLMKAVKSGNVECVQILISKGADVSIVGRSGEYRGTALDLARRMKLHRMVDILAATSDGATCEICAEDADVHMRTEWRARSITPGCKHPRRICFSCTRRHIEAEVNQKGNPEIRCPHNECAALLTHADIQHFATSEHFERFDLLAMRRCLQQMPDFMWCAHPECGSGQETPGAGAGKAVPGGLRGMWMRCSSCRHQTCLHHNCPLHEGQSCEEYDAAARESEEVGLLQYVNSSAVKRCPKCQHGIEKSGGCDHITCRKEAGGCGAEWCWLCLADYNGPGGIRAVGNSAHASTCQYNF